MADFKTTEYKWGFIIESQRREVAVSLDLASLRFYVGSSKHIRDEHDFSAGFGLFSFADLMKAIAVRLINHDDFPATTSAYGKIQVRKHRATKVKRMLAKYIASQRTRLIAERIDEKHFAVMKRLYNVCYTDHDIDMELFASDNGNLIYNDIMRYRSAAQFLSIPESTTYPISLQSQDNISNSSSIERSKHIVLNWRNNLSPYGKSYHALNVTLDNWPASMTAHALNTLRYVKLEHPILQRRSLLCLLSLVRNFNNRHVNMGVQLQAQTMHELDHIRHIAQHFTSADIKAGVVLYRAIVGDDTLSQNRWSTFTAIAQYIHDGYPIDSTAFANLKTYAGLIRRSHQLHEDAIRLHRENRIKQNGEWFAKKTHRPPIELPDIEGITFLDTVESIYSEADIMNHCINQYDHSAVSGNSYLFHIEHKGKSASIEVSSIGHVRQAFGPDNKKNAACAYGEMRLNEWGRNLPSDVPF